MLPPDCSALSRLAGSGAMPPPAAQLAAACALALLPLWHEAVTDEPHLPVASSYVEALCGGGADLALCAARGGGLLRALYLPASSSAKLLTHRAALLLELATAWRMRAGTGRTMHARQLAHFLTDLPAALDACPALSEAAPQVGSALRDVCHIEADSEAGWVG